MSDDCSYGFGCTLDLGFDDAVSKVEKQLEKRGFRILTHLRLCDLLSEQARQNFGRYVILGACNREFAGRLFNADLNIGLLMPCNIVVYELQGGGCKVMVKDPLNIMDLVKSPRAIEAIIQVKEQLEEFVEALQEKKKRFSIFG